MMDLLPGSDLAIGGLMFRHVPELDVVGPGRWRFSVGGDPLLWADVRLEQGWLRFRVALGEGRPRQLDVPMIERMLACNATLQGGAKFGLAGDANQPVLGAELSPTDESADWEARAGRTYRGLRQGVAAFEGKSPCGPHDASPGTATAGAIDVPALCREAGWPFHERSDGQVAVPLEVPDMYLQAAIRPWDHGLLCVEAPLESLPHAAGGCRAAVGVLLLTACGAVRMVRATARPGETEVEYAWQAVVDPVAEELRHALAAISVACRLSAREVEALRDQTIAAKYLAVRGWSSLASNGVS
jgi:hypothetical protein